jgi:hypothetical protein
MLVASNLAMLPAMIHSLQRRLSFIFIVFLCTAMGSAIYHLCDTEAICFANWSFDSYHSVDVLMSCTCIVMIFLRYSPLLSHLNHAALTLFAMILLLIPIINDTFPIGIVIVCSGIITLIHWIIWFYNRHNNPVNTSQQHLINIKSDNEQHMENDNIQTTSQDRLLLLSNDLEQSHDSTNSRSEHQNSCNSTNQEQNDILQDADLELIHLNATSHPVHTISLSASKQIDNQHNYGFCTLIINPLAGALLGIIGISCYVFDDRTNYWYLHSIWHIAMMISAFLFLRGQLFLFKKYHIDIQ